MGDDSGDSDDGLSDHDSCADPEQAADNYES